MRSLNILAQGALAAAMGLAFSVSALVADITGAGATFPSVLSLGCQPLDELLGSSLESGIITRIYAEAGSGKTNFCLQAARQCVLSGKKVAYIDTEGVSVERIRQICVECDYKRILRDILFFTPTSFESQEQMICDAIAAKGIGLIVIDTITMFID